MNTREARAMRIALWTLGVWLVFWGVLVPVLAAVVMR